MRYTDEPFIMASQERKFFMSMIQPIRNGNCIKGRSMHKNHDEDCLDLLETVSFSLATIQDKVDDITDDIHAIRSVHNEGIWEKTIP